MAEDMEADGRGNPGTGACLGKRPLLVGRSPRLAICAEKKRRIVCPASQLPEAVYSAGNIPESQIEFGSRECRCAEGARLQR
jgi:hypothetical protein